MMFRTRFKLTRTAAVSALAVGVAIALSSFSVVRAEHSSPAKKVTSFNCSSGTACLTAASSGGSTWALYAESTSVDAVHAVTSATGGTSAVTGIAQGTTGVAQGVYGSSNNGDGVYGASSAPPKGSIGYSGVFGISNTTGTGSGVVGEAGASSTGFGVAAFADGTNSGIFYGLDGATGDSCYIDDDANLTCSGKISGSVIQMRQPSSRGSHVLTYSSQSASATIEDVGTARMSDGVANVQISPDFAAVMDRNWYYVFLTPLGDTRGLYVSMKTASAFQVRETERGRDSLEFDYRIVAHPLGAANDRLPPVPSTRRLAQPAHPH
jgi:hypothetical protein